MAQRHTSVRRIQVDKANVMIVTVVAVACFVTIFSLVASKMLLGQRQYQAKVIEKKTEALEQLNENLEARDELVEQYKVFVGQPNNVIGGLASGVGPRSGDNATIILDALPSRYDFPALTTSLEKLITENDLTIRAISGTDEELEHSDVEAEANPTPVEIPFQISLEGGSDKIEAFLGVLQRSIRPIHVQTLTISGNDERLTADITAKTYYQPAKSLTIKSEVVEP